MSETAMAWVADSIREAAEAELFHTTHVTPSEAILTAAAIRYGSRREAIENTEHHIWPTVPPEARRAVLAIYDRLTEEYGHPPAQKLIGAAVWDFYWAASLEKLAEARRQAGFRDLGL